MSSLLALNVLDPHSLLSAFGHSASATGSHAGVSGDAVEEHDTGLHDLLEGDPER